MRHALLLTAALSSCPSLVPRPPGGVVQIVPTTFSVIVSPAAPTTLDDLVARHTPAYLPVAWTWVELGSGETISGPVVPAARTEKGQVWEARATGRIGSWRSAQVTIGNAPPQVAHVQIEGASPCQPFTCQAHDVADPDGDPVTVLLQWRVDGALVATGPTLPDGLAVDGATVACEAVASDGEDGAPPVSSVSVSVEDRAPVFTALQIPGDVRRTEPVACRVSAVDDCTDPLPISTSWTVNGLPVPARPDGKLDTVGLAVGSQIACTASVDDGVNPPVTATSSTTTTLPETWSLVGGVAGGRAGYAVSVLGDVDGDGFLEVAVGAPDTTAGNATQVGAVYVVDGRNDVLTTALDDVTEGEGGLRLTGTSGSYDLATMACTPYVVSGCPTVTSVGSLDGEDRGPAGAGFGAALGASGDADGDGVPDLVVGAPYELVGNLWRGRTYALSGVSLASNQAALLDGAGFGLVGECGRRRDLDQSMRNVDGGWKATNADLAGYRVVGLGDANGDGLADVAVSAPTSGDDDEGTVYVVFGVEEGAPLDAAQLFARDCGAADATLPGALEGLRGFAAYGPDEPVANTAPANWGKRVATGGDFNGDGYADVIVSSPGLTATNVTHVVLGGRAPTSVPLVWPTTDLSRQWPVLLGNFRFGSGGTTGRFGVGFPSGGGGDVNADGLDDVAFVARDYDRDTFLNVLFGRTVDDDGTLRLDETHDGSGRGFTVGGSINMSSESGVALVAGDLDGDGYDDVVVSAVTEETNRGRVYVIYGAQEVPGITATTLRSGQGGYVIVGEEDHEQLGSSIAAGDVDGDGLVDLVIGAPGRDAVAGWDAGRALVAFGRDRRGRVSQRGGPGSDLLVASSPGASLVGGRGSDLLSGRGGADVLYGGEGDDTLEVANGAFRRVRGGPGEDTLLLGAGLGAFVLSELRSRVDGIEHIGVDGHTVVLSTPFVHRLSDTSRLRVSGASGVVETTPGDRWVSLGFAPVDGVEHLVLVDGRAELWIDARLDTFVPPTVSDAPVPVPEGLAVGDVAFVVDALDPDGLDEDLRFVLDDDPRGALTLDAVTGVARVLDAAAFDFESGGAWQIEVTVTDGQGLSTSARLPIALQDLPEPPAFVTTAPVLSVEEGTHGVLGSVAAVDPDVGDEISFVVSDDPSGLFTVDALTGELGLLPGATLDHETASLHLFTVAAVDLSGLWDEVLVEVHVGDVDVIERDLRVTFELRQRSIWGDDAADRWAPLNVPGVDASGNLQKCFTVPTADALHSENFSTSWNNGWPSAPLSYEAEISGTFCTGAEVTYEEGAWNATVPVDIALDLPDEVTPGATFQVTSSAVPTSEGAAFWGTGAGLELGFSVELRNANFYMAGCDSVFSKQCSVLVDRRGVNRTFRDRYGSVPVTWEGGLLDDPSRFVLTVAEPVVADTTEITVDWDRMWLNLATFLGLPSNRGHYDFNVGGTSSGMYGRFDYVLMQTYVGFYSDSSWVFDLEVHGVDALVTFENGATATFRLGGTTSLVAPAGGDVDGDGDVDVDISLSLASTFTDRWVHEARAGYAYTGGFGRFRVESVAGDLLAQRQVGPALEHACAPKVSGVAVPLTCLTSGRSETYRYDPTSFNRPAILGALDLSAP